MNTPRALSINGKRINITIDDVLPLAEAMAIKNPMKIIQEIQGVIPEWEKIATTYNVPLSIAKDFKALLADVK